MTPKRVSSLNHKLPILFYSSKPNSGADQANFPGETPSALVWFQ